MANLAPIYTEKHECQDCYKCVRQCPVKAIKVQDAYATIVPEMCVYCGHCVAVCPNAAKHVRNDLARARHLIGLPQRVFVSLAPSWLTEFGTLTAPLLIAALKKLGFAGVSETALGAQQVSAHVARALQEEPARILLSSACPTVVAYVQKHRPHLTASVTGLFSPLLAHCRMLRQHYGESIGIVFIGPCIAKKLEADDNPELLDLALTFEDLRLWLAAERIDPSALMPGPEDVFVPQGAEEGVLYPVDGGMIAGIQAHCAVDDAAFMSFSGLAAVEKALDGLEEIDRGHGLFLELLACEGGCVNGPKVSRQGSTVTKRRRILDHARFPDGQAVPRQPDIDIRCPILPLPLDHAPPTEAQISEVLRSIGKRSLEDELNCGGCGYDSCREFGKALIADRAERAMCVSWMRQLAFKKANVLIHKMPSAVVIVDSDLRVLECNQAFLAIISHPGDTLPTAVEGVSLDVLLPFANLFASVLKNGMDIIDRDIRFLDTILHLSIFTIEPHTVVGAIIQDITRPAVQKEQVIKRAREVIRKNLATVQKIAYLLGENAAESEVTLNSIIASFTAAQLDEDDGDDEGGKHG